VFKSVFTGIREMAANLHRPRRFPKYIYAGLPYMLCAAGGRFTERKIINAELVRDHIELRVKYFQHLTGNHSASPDA
jgi:hypothetical protein